MTQNNTIISVYKIFYNNKLDNIIKEHSQLIHLNILKIMNLEYIPK